MSSRFFLIPLALLMTLAGCATAKKKNLELRLPAIQILGDAELDRLNDEELFAKGASYFAAKDYQQAVRYFNRIVDFFPQSSHRAAALYNAGLAHEQLNQWSEALVRFSALSNPKGFKDALDAAFRVAEAEYHLDKFQDAIELLTLIVDRTDLPGGKRIEAQVQKGICQVEANQLEQAEDTLRKALQSYHLLQDPEEVEDYFPAQAQFFLGEIYRLHYESIRLDPSRGTDQLAKDLEYKSELLLSAQGHYLRAIRMGNNYWSTASGTQVGSMYQNLYQHMIEAPVPPELDAEEGAIYRQELKKKIRVLLSKAISVYERTLEAAERLKSSGPFIERARESLKKMKDLLVAESE